MDIYVNLVFKNKNKRIGGTEAWDKEKDIE